MSRKFLVTATPPTTNGDLHVGHLAGPYLGADVFKRYQLQRGNEVLYVSSGDDNQSYVVTTSLRLGRDPREVITDFAGRIQITLKAACIEMDIFTSPDQEHTLFIQGFFHRLYNAEKIVAKEKDHFFCENCNRFLFESYINGYCPACFKTTKGNICESCGNANDPIDLISPRCSISKNHTISRKRVKSLFLELEPLREQFRDFFDKQRGIWRPHIMQLVFDVLDKPLPDYPISFISDWGIPVPFPGFEGQVINVWAEMLPGLMESTRKAAMKHSPKVSVSDLWNAENGYELVQFLGFDNSFFFAIVHIALLMTSQEEWILPSAIITNEFYQLENYKFSTSKNHVIWGVDLLEKFPVDQVRYYLCLTNPEHQQTNFLIEEFIRITDEKLSKPWNQLLSQYNHLVYETTDFSESELAYISYVLTDKLEVFAHLMESAYEIKSISLRKAAETLTNWICWLSDHISETEASGLVESTNKISKYRAAAAYQGLRALAIFSEPIMPQFSTRLREALNMEHNHWEGYRENRNITLNKLPDKLLFAELSKNL
ncbi:class I tRNA ligase family protein [Halotia wernerae UHCC 0503]|nr:class I tRNA ligase family protein [Halotia wernerae UHCC 0503]